MIRGVSKVNCFIGLNRVQANELGSWMKAVEVNRGQLIFKEGDKSDGLYVLRSGEVSVEKDSEQGRVQLALFKAPSFFGEASLLINIRRTANLKALTPVKLALLPKKMFREKLNERNRTAFLVSVNIARLMAERLAETNRDVALATARLASDR